MMRTYITFLSALALTILPACHRDKAINSLDKIVRLDDYVERLVANPGDTVGMDIDALSVYMQIIGASPSTSVNEAVDSFAATAAFNIFHEDVNNQREVFESMQDEMAQLNKKINSSIGLNYNLRFFGIVSPYPRQIIRNGGDFYIALNHYLGEDYPGYNGMPEYIRRTKTPERIPIDVAEALIATEYPFRPAPDATTLNRLLYEGALVYSMEQITGRPIADILGWTPTQLKSVTNAESLIWSKMISDELLYSSDSTIASRLVDPSPATAIINPELPGRVGRYIGYNIIRAYLRNNDATIHQLLSPEFYNNNLTLIKSNYHG